MNGQFRLLYRRLLANCLHGKAAELCLANSGNIKVATTKYVKFHCDVITRSSLQLINTSINIFFSKLRAFLRNKEEGRPVMAKRKLDGPVDESSADQKIRKSDVTVHNL